LKIICLRARHLRQTDSLRIGTFDLKILLYEHAASGGFAGRAIDTGILSEGYAMLQGFAFDLKAAGHSIVLMQDSRLESLLPFQVDKIIRISSSEDIDVALVENLADCDASFLIAPETDQRLSELTKIVENQGEALSLNCKSSAIELTSDKVNLGKKTRQLGLDAPKSTSFSTGVSREEIVDKIQSLSLPMVIKPSVGAGCNFASLIRDEKELGSVMEGLKDTFEDHRMIAQEFVEGVSVSVSLVCTNKGATPISLNLQNVTLASPNLISEYKGGMLPYEHPLRCKAFDAARRLVESFEGLKGYVGVDLVLSDERVFVIEVNSRLTTSYIGLRNVSKINLAEAVIRAVLNNESLTDFEIEGYSFFSKINLPNNPRLHSWICNFKEAIVPPLLYDEKSVKFFITSTGKSRAIAKAYLDRVTVNLEQKATEEEKSWQGS
jgi:predicted ATP-grasp superfamily ATP-dependent carboligase